MLKNQLGFDTHCLLRWDGFVLIEKNCNLINATIRIKSKNWKKKEKKERSTHTTFHVNAIVSFVLQKEISIHNS